MRQPGIRESAKAGRFSESVIREMTRVASRHGAINLAQGFPDFPAPDALKEAAARYIREDRNQYATTWGSDSMRAAIGAWMQRRRGLTIDPDTQVTVCCGATEGMVAAMLGTLDPGEQVLVPEPYYENYGPDGILCDAEPVYIPMGDGFSLDVDALHGACGPRTRAVVLNTPHNPTGRVFSDDEVAALCALVRERDLLLFTDEIYEEILFAGEHRSPALLEGMAERTIIVSGASKNFSVTGWRIGWVVSPPALTSGIRKVHDFLTVGAPAPLQEAVAEAMLWDDGYFDGMRAEYDARRHAMVDALRGAGFACELPEGAYYLMVDVSERLRAGESDVDFAMRLVEEAGVATVPGSSFYGDPADGARYVRFCYAKRLETLEEAGRRLRAWAERG
jgi:aminotransferase